MTAAACRVVAMRSGDWGEIKVVSSLPDNMLDASQARSLAEVEEVAQSVVADLLEIDADDIEAEVRSGTAERHPGVNRFV